MSTEEQVRSEHREDGEQVQGYMPTAVELPGSIGERKAGEQLMPQILPQLPQIGTGGLALPDGGIR